MPPQKIGKFAGSWMIIKQSWNVLAQDKEVMLFPVASAFVSLIAFIIMLVIGFFVVLGGALGNIGEVGGEVMGYVLLFIYYVVMFFITCFFQAAVMIVVKGRFSGQNLSFGDGISGAFANFGKLLAFSVISATVGVILQIIADRFKFVGAIIASILGAAWAILTYFSLPSLVIGQHGVKDSFKDSAAVIRKTWGEAIIVNFGVGFVFGLATFFAIILAVGLAIVAPVVEVWIAIVIALIMFLVGVSILSSTLGIIFKLALYEYAKNGVVPQGFSQELIAQAIKSK